MPDIFDEVAEEVRAERLRRLLSRYAGLIVEVVLLVVYVVLGVLALRRARTAGARRIFFVTALVTYIYMLGVARMHYPLGRLQGWLA